MSEIFLRRDHLTVGAAVTGLGAAGTLGYVIYELELADAYAYKIVPIDPNDLTEAHEVFERLSDDAIQQAHEAIQRGDESITLRVDDQALKDAEAVLRLEEAHNAVQQEYVDSAGVVPASYVGLGSALVAVTLLALAVRKFDKTIRHSTVRS